MIIKESSIFQVWNDLIRVTTHYDPKGTILKEIKRKMKMCLSKKVNVVLYNYCSCVVYRMSGVIFQKTKTMFEY